MDFLKLLMELNLFLLNELCIFTLYFDKENCILIQKLSITSYRQVWQYGVFLTDDKLSEGQYR